MSTEQHIDPEVLIAARDAFIDSLRGDELPAFEAALNAADEKRRELAQADPEGQEYAYRYVWTSPDGLGMGEHDAESQKEAEHEVEKWERLGFPAWVERALLGDWERVG